MKSLEDNDCRQRSRSMTTGPGRESRHTAISGGNGAKFYRGNSERMVQTGPNPPNPDQARREAAGKDDASKKPVELYAMPSNSNSMQIVQMQILHIQNENTNNSNLHTIP